MLNQLILKVKYWQLSFCTYKKFNFNRLKWQIKQQKSQIHLFLIWQTENTLLLKGPCEPGNKERNTHKSYYVILNMICVEKQKWSKP